MMVPKWFWTQMDFISIIWNNCRKIEEMLVPSTRWKLIQKNFKERWLCSTIFRMNSNKALCRLRCPTRKPLRLKINRWSNLRLYRTFTLGYECSMMKIYSCSLYQIMSLKWTFRVTKLRWYSIVGPRWSHILILKERERCMLSTQPLRLIT